MLADFDYGSAAALAETRLLPEGSDQVGATTADPLYGTLYLPRKFKIGLATVDDNSIDVLTNDLAIIPVFAGDQRLEHYIIAVGGGFGMSHNRADTFPRLATPVCVVAPDELLAITRSGDWLAARPWRPHRSQAGSAEISGGGSGDRLDQAGARPADGAGFGLAAALAWLCGSRPSGLAPSNRGINSAAAESASDAAPAAAESASDAAPAAAESESADERFYYGIVVPSGRIHDTATQQYRRAIRQIVEQFAPDLVVTPGQDLIFANLPRESQPGDRADSA